MNLLVTGSSGYVASHLVPALVAQGHRVVGVDRVAGDERHLCRFIRGDLNEPAVAESKAVGRNNRGGKPPLYCKLRA